MNSDNNKGLSVNYIKQQSSNKVVTKLDQQRFGEAKAYKNRKDLLLLLILESR